jgi:NADH-quinone oxidoreductase subunit N
VAGALNAAIAAAYYLRVVGTMYFRGATAENAHLQPGGSGSLAAAVVCGVLVVLLGVSPKFVLTGTQNAERSAMHLGTAPSARPAAVAARE